MENYEEIIVHWEKKVDVESLSDLTKIAGDGKDVIYQIYGDHHVYGRETLLYIGISINAHHRFISHLKGVFGYVNNLSVSFGKVSPNVKNMEIPESILIANHKPSFNKEFIHDLCPEAKSHKIILINNGCNYMLKTCCTNYWWV